MSDITTIYVKDTCFLIDLIGLKMVDIFLKLNLKIITTEFVKEEIRDENQLQTFNSLVEKGVITIDVDADFLTLSGICSECGQLSITDASIIELASRKLGIILSNDNKLRRYAEDKSMPVHGIVGIIEQLYDKSLMTGEAAKIILEKYLLINKRAPKQHIEILINKIESSTLIKI